MHSLNQLLHEFQALYAVYRDLQNVTQSLQTVSW